MSGPAIRLLNHDRVSEIVGRFEALNPYDRNAVPGSVLELEQENLDQATREQLEIEALAIASKRYALHLRDEDGRPVLLGRAGKRRRSEHGLGHLLPPLAEKPDSEDPGWLDQWRHHPLCHELDVHDEQRSGSKTRPSGG